MAARAPTPGDVASPPSAPALEIGQLAGRKVELAYEDEANDAAIAEQKARNLVERNQVDLMRAPSCSPSTSPPRASRRDPVEQVGDGLVELRWRGPAILPVKRNLAHALRVVDRVDAIDDGRIVCEGRLEGLRAEPAVLHRYVDV